MLVNVSLLGSLIFRKLEERAALRRMEAELVELFATQGITLEAGAISWEAPPAPITMARSEDLEQSVAEFLLGQDLRGASQGGINSYQSAAGSIQFRSSGGFEARLSAPEGEDLCRSFCRTFSYGTPVFQENGDGSATAAAVFQYGGRPVYNCTVTFTLTGGALTAVSGTLLPTEGVPTGQSGLLSAAAALTAFQQMRRESGTVGSSILQTYPCYEVQSTPSAATTLMGAWCVVTDISSYYVNCSTGAITVG